MTDSERIRELMLVNLFAVFNQRDAEPLAGSASRCNYPPRYRTLAGEH